MPFIAVFALLFLILWGVFLGAAPVIQHALSRIGHRTAEFRYRDYLPVALLLGGGIALTAFAGDAFLDLAELLHANSPMLQRADTLAHEWSRAERSTGATLFFSVFTVAGGPVAMAATVVVVTAILAFRRRFRWAAYLAITTGAGALLVTQLKIYFARARPDLAEALRQAHGYSFPSGHAMGSTIVAGALAYLALRGLPTWRAKAAGLAGAVTFIAAVAFSRVYLGVHWISDVGAGIAAGLLWVTVATVAYETFRRIRLVRMGSHLEN